MQAMEKDKQAAVSCCGLRFAYESKPVLHGIDFSASAARITALLGKNGAGKSTTINILMGFLRPTAGKCSVLGHPSHALPPLVRREIGLLHEGFIQYDYMTIAEVERFYAPFYPRWNAECFFDLVDRMGLPRTRRISHMSCGQRSQVGLGLILAQQPEFIILDDYSMGLDVGYRQLFLEMLREYVEKYQVGVLLTSHVVRELEGIADDVVVLREGRVVAAGSCQKVIGSLGRYRVPLSAGALELKPGGPLVNIERHPEYMTLYTQATVGELLDFLEKRGISGMQPHSAPMCLEDAFIGLTGRY